MATNPAIQKAVDALMAYIASIGADIDDLVAKIKTLNDTIAQLQATQGQLTPEDQALLDNIQAQGKALADKADAADGKTPPPPPPPV